MRVTHSFTQQIYTEHLLCASHCSRTGDTKTNKTDIILCPQGSYIPGKNEEWSLDSMTKGALVGDFGENSFSGVLGESEWKVR